MEYSDSGCIKWVSIIEHDGELDVVYYRLGDFSGELPCTIKLG